VSGERYKPSAHDVGVDLVLLRIHEWGHGQWESRLQYICTHVQNVSFQICMLQQLLLAVKQIKRFFKSKGFRVHAVCCYPGTGVTFVALWFSNYIYPIPSSIDFLVAVLLPYPNKQGNKNWLLISFRSTLLHYSFRWSPNVDTMLYEQVLLARDTIGADFCLPTMAPLHKPGVSSSLLALVGVCNGTTFIWLCLFCHATENRGWADVINLYYWTQVSTFPF
jgi:hypothetical protein